MNEQLRRWILITGAAAGAVGLMNSWQIYELWQMSGSNGYGGGPQSNRWTLMGEGLLWPLGETLAVPLLLALTLLISRFLLRGRFRVVVGGLLLALAALGTSWFTFHGAIESYSGLVFGAVNLANTTALGLAAGCWILRDRTPRPERDRISPEILGVWDTPGGVLEFESDGVFTLTSAHGRGGSEGSITAGLWEPLPGTRPRIVLKVDADTALGHGWQATVLDLDTHPYGAVLRAGAAQYRRREAEAVLEHSTGYIGAVEVLEG
ncbi:hypothetical protein [Streptacidiphilus sp. PAMC 29251]